MISIKNVSKSFINKKEVTRVLEDINLDISKGDIYGVLGLSGAGKTTLLRIISGLEKPDTGEVVIDGTNINDVLGKNLREFKKKIGVVFQGVNLLMQQTVYKNISFPLEIDKVPKEEIDKKVKEMCKLVGIEEKIDLYPSQLSGGQCQRVAIARALVCNPKVLLLDEVTSALDPFTTKQVLHLLKNINEKLDVTIVIITHDIKVAKTICNHIAVVDGGNIIEKGTIKDVTTNPQSEFCKILFGGDE